MTRDTSRKPQAPGVEPELPTLLHEEREVIRATFLRDLEPAPVVERLSQLSDRVLRQVVPTGPEPSFVVLAIGGYGRRQLFPCSDLDLFCFSPGGPSSEERIRQFLHALWDLGFEVGQHVWSHSQLQELGEDHFELMLALLDARALIGPQEQAQWLQHEFIPSVIERYRQPLVEFVVEGTRSRYQRFSDTIYQLEPDLKQSPGGLRDYLTGRWLERLGPSVGILSYRRTELKSAFDFLSRLRILLHYVTGRDRNRLLHQLQEKLAPLAGHSGKSPRSRVESLMKEYFLHARVLSTFCCRSIQANRPSGGPPIQLESQKITDLEAVLDIYNCSIEEGRPVGDDLREEIVRRLPRISEGIAFSRLAVPVRRLFQPRAGLYEALSELYELGVLELLFPEFGTIKARVIRDFYHRYTVDEHSLLAIRAIEHLAEPQSSADDRRFSDLLEGLEKPEILTLSLLLHDVGKSRGGKHVDTGARMAARALRRFRFEKSLIDQVIFLIRNHLAMSAVMLRRNLEDPDVVRSFADLTGDSDSLRLLCLLTFADIRAVAPEALNQWKRERLWQLYVTAYNKLTVDFGEERIDAQTSVDILIDKLPSDIDSNAFASFLDGFPRRYLATTPPAEIREHFRLGNRLSPEDPVQILLRRKSSHWELCVVTADRHGMFSRIAGLLAYFQMNILRGYAFSNRRDTVLDFFQFSDTQRVFRLNPGERKRFRRLLVEVIEGEQSVEELLHRKESSFLYQPVTAPREPIIFFDPEGRKDYSILEIVASDSIGLLYRISREISALDCNIELVLITTEGDQAVDVFYLTHQSGKLSSSLKRRMAERIKAVIGPAT